MRADIIPGAVFPDYEPSDHTGTHRKLSELQASDPMIMVLSRGGYCGVGAHWPFLSDPGRKVQKDLDIAEYTDPQHNPMIPHTFVLEPGLIVFSVYNGKLDLKAAWQRGDKARFFPYGKTYAEEIASQA